MIDKNLSNSMSFYDFINALHVGADKYNNIDLLSKKKK